MVGFFDQSRFQAKPKRYADNTQGAQFKAETFAKHRSVQMASQAPYNTVPAAAVPDAGQQDNVMAR